MKREQRPGDENRGAEQDRGRSEDEDTTDESREYLDPFAVPLPFEYGRDWPDTDAWVDRDGQVHTGDGPYASRRWSP